ncbi:NmrA family NAD(P)-binding protein [Actinosynnema sp.]|uniref:NmrA family NAD(P)-binding protein n=1 Tax=Actinosynnema sp. TaxID=1872144 RepID=UPI003F86082C
MTSTLVIGGTGLMGSRVVRALLGAGTVTAFTRDPESTRARALRDLGAGAAKGDLDEPGTLRAALEGVDQVFCNTDHFGAGGVLAEHRQGVTALEAAREAGVARFIWSSLDGVSALTGGRVRMSHYDAKAGVAAHVHTHRADEAERGEEGWHTRSTSILTTAPYYENFPVSLPPERTTLPDGRTGALFRVPLGERGRYPLIALDDIAWFAARMFEDWHGWGARDLAVVADSPTGAQIAATFERVTGIPSAYLPVPLEAVRANGGHDFASMFEFFQTRDVADLDRDLPALRRLHPGLMTFEDWLRATGWTGEAA